MTTPIRERVWGYSKILLLAGALITTFFVFAGIAMRVAVRARQVTVPDLVGKPIADATAIASSLDLQLRIEEGKRPDAKVPAGHVLGQEPVAGSAARRQRSVRVWLSAGAHIARAPSLIGETQRSAEIRAAQEGLAIGAVSGIRSAAYAPDVIVAQDPPPGTQTAEVRLLVNRGEDRATYVMPDLIGLNGDRVADVMRTRGFRVSITAQSAASAIPPGVVVRQSPAGGYQVHPGDAIALEVSR
ncbi:MAG TPA: PASTA domain-containing protein [Vicinamibacterales bacterium]|nr:PASTA domain-containing protein [Vicinamibacterales bacterium]